MKKIILIILSLAIVLTPAFAEDKKEAKKAAKKQKPRIEVCFVLDTTGSMGGLIAGAKEKIWSMANEIISAKPTPEIRIGLIGYRDKTDAYITKAYPLSNDIDDIYGKLMAFKAQGGGDTPESVNQALNEGVTKMKWSKSRDVLKVIFLVGDAPPHMDYKQDVKYTDSCKLAMKKDIIVNTIQCGNMASTTPIWQEIAHKAEGKFARILQSGGVIAIATPFDKEIAACNAKLGHTVCVYGDTSAQRFAASKVTLAQSAPAAAAADRLAYLSKDKESSLNFGAVISGGGDLIDLLANKKIKLADIEEKKLPENIRKMKAEEREAYFAKQIEDRKKLQTKLTGLLKKRSTFIITKKAELKKAGKGDGFDEKVGGFIREQAAKKGFRYEK
ncbi:VWA domain-containing protein [Verrucomicrobia bacterium]|nr:VWA domain-containing protein [Verrucomicrobiota bacterium]